MADFEKPATFKAGNLLQPEILKGQHHSVDDAVQNDGLLYHYTVASPFGAFTANSTRSLHTLIHEIEAIAAMRAVDTGDVAVESLKQSGKSTVTGLKNLVTDPKGTFEGAVSGVNSLFVRTKGTLGKRETTGAEDSRMEQLIGLSKSKGAMATRYGVSAYSRNEVLQEELDRLARADYLGGLSVGVAGSFVPGVGGLVLSTSGTARLLNETINNTPASELWLRNSKKLLEMGVNEDTVELFLNNPSFSPALETVLVEALADMQGVVNRELFISIALQAADPETAKIITETAVMSAGYHQHVAPLKKLAPMARLAHGIKENGAVVVTLPTDHIIWSDNVAQVAAFVTEKADPSKGAGVEIWTIGDFSKRAQTELQKMGWTLYPDSFRKLVPKD